MSRTEKTAYRFLDDLKDKLTRAHSRSSWDVDVLAHFSQHELGYLLDLVKQDQERTRAAAALAKSAEL